MEKCQCSIERINETLYKCIECNKTVCCWCGKICESCDGKDFFCKGCFEKHDKIHNIVSEFENPFKVSKEDREKVSTVYCASCGGRDFKVARFSQDTKVTCVKCGCWKLFEWYE